MKTKHQKMWFLTILFLSLVDIVATYNETEGDTLSEAIREGFKTDTRKGKTFFVATWVTLSLWFVPHILKGTIDEVEKVLENKK